MNLPFLQKLHEENEKLFDKLTEKAKLAGPQQVCYFHRFMIIKALGGHNNLCFASLIIRLIY